MAFFCKFFLEIFYQSIHRWKFFENFSKGSTVENVFEIFFQTIYCRKCFGKNVKTFTTVRSVCPMGVFFAPWGFFFSQRIYCCFWLKKFFFRIFFVRKKKFFSQKQQVNPLRKKKNPMGQKKPPWGKQTLNHLEKISKNIFWKKFQKNLQKNVILRSKSLGTQNYP